MNRDEIKALKHIVIHGNSQMLRAKKWGDICRELYKKGYLQRMYAPIWSWTSTKAGRKAIMK